MPEELMERLLEYEIHLPGEIAKRVTAKWAYERTMCLGFLKTHDGICKWCDIAPLPTYRHYYCGDHCRISAFIFCNPQAPMAKAYHLMKQLWACTICGQCYEDRALQTIANHIESELNVRPTQLLFWIGYRISREMDMDHITPIYKGGVGIGIRNHQVICRPCHHRKTASER